MYGSFGGVHGSFRNDSALLNIDLAVWALWAHVVSLSPSLPLALSLSLSLSPSRSLSLSLTEILKLLGPIHIEGLFVYIFKGFL